jgi:phosphotransferase system enzyme I (PtsP)
VVPYLRSQAEENPAMGYRSIRLGLDRLGLLRTQIRALLVAADGRALKILVPMVTETWEFRQTRTVVKRELERLRRSGGTLPVRLELGAMIEVPSLLFELDQLLPEADFVSIGSNDLVQFLTAADRANPRVSNTYDPIGTPRLRAIKQIVDAARRYNVPITMCGELAGKPVEALALMAIGMTRLSMGPASIGPIKELVLNLELKPIRQSVAAALSDGAEGVSVRELLTDWIDRQNLPI